MIGRIRGELIGKQPPALLIDVGGVAYEIEAPMSTIYGLPAMGETVTLHTHLLVREDAQLLFGFASLTERGLFRELLKVSGIGAKMALAMLSTFSGDDLAAIVESGDREQLVRVPGIGKKTADRVLLELRGRLELNAGAASAGPGMDSGAEAVEALQALGYSQAEARRLIKPLLAESHDTESLIRSALRRAAK